MDFEMHQKEKIARYVLLGELIESDILYETFRDFGGNKNLRGRAARAEWLAENVNPEELDQFVDFLYVRVCSHCGKPMCWGYCICGGNEYYCSDECLHQHYTKEEFGQMYDNGNGDSYYTSWLE